MKIIFISSGNSEEGISPIVKNQAMSLQKEDIDLKYFQIIGKGVLGYIKNVYPLKKYLKSNKFDIIHAHYSLSAFVASLAGAKPMIVSLMGSDVKSNGYYKFVIKFFNKLFWSKIIVKSKDMKNTLNINNVDIVPNGVDFDKFKPIDRKLSLKETGWNISKKHVLFAANPERHEKNYLLAKTAFELLSNKNLELHHLDNVSNDKMPFYYNASDVVLLTSLWEGSPNVIKEAMACNIPIVSTDVGDVKELLDSIEGCYISSYSPDNVAEMIKLASLCNRTNGRDILIELGLDSNTVAGRIINIYKEVLHLN
jgi:glycosyltransferase involved in cell wall biosynthesis